LNTNSFEIEDKTLGITSGALPEEVISEEKKEVDDHREWYNDD